MVGTEKNLMHADRFALEEALVSCENIADDLNVLIVDILEGDNEPDADKIVNILQGLADLHRIRCQQTFDLFEQLVKNRIIR
ncbi:hypothetical protein EBZ39_01910 [bacterium]|nr:hypothetical protein [bacterium]